MLLRLFIKGSPLLVDFCHSAVVVLFSKPKLVKRKIVPGRLEAEHCHCGQWDILWYLELELQWRLVNSAAFSFPLAPKSPDFIDSSYHQPTCEQCGKVFMLKSNFQKHIAMIVIFKLCELCLWIFVKCPQCDKNYIT